MPAPPERKQTASQVGALIFGEKPTTRSRNHARENWKAIREAEARNREKRAEEALPKKPEFKLKEFRDVKTRVYDGGHTEPGKEYLKKGAGEEKPTPAEIFRKKFGKIPSQNSLETTPRKEAIPKQRAVLAPRPETDWIEKNKTQQQFQKPKKTTEITIKTKHDDFGSIPQYLVQRKLQLQAEKEAKRLAAPDPDAPPGTVRMPEADRLAMLASLREQIHDVEALLGRFPLHITTLKQKQRKAALETKFDQLLKSKAIFDRPIVYIQE